MKRENRVEREKIMKGKNEKGEKKALNVTRDRKTREPGKKK